jgi:extracellular elastinolytic metalloproteinase
MILAALSHLHSRRLRAAASVTAAAALLTLAAPAAHGALAGPAAGDPADIARAYVEAHRADLGLTAQDLAEWTLADRYADDHNGVTHLYFVQRLDGIAVIEGVLNVAVAADGSVLHLGNRFHGDLAGSVPHRQPSITAAQAVEAAAAHLGLAAPAALTVVAEPGGAAQEVVFAGDGLSRRDVSARLAWLSIGPQRARLVWQVAIEPDENHYWELSVDARAATVLEAENRVLADSYRVYPLPLESPNHHPDVVPPLDGRVVVGTVGAPGVSPADPVASPHGWHDTPAGAPATAIPTAGNNVAAYTDTTQTDSPDPGDPPISLTGDFDFPIDLTQGPETYQDALVTNLFYWTNQIHDLFFHFGFTEAAGNFQLTNYTGAGLGNDPLKAEAQDGSGTNNANMLTLRDGVPPRMQMFIFTPPFNAEVAVNSPAGLGPFTAASAGFGPPLPPGGLTADVVLVDDGAAAPSTSDACEPIAQDLSGRLAVVDRGTCNFTVKVQNCQNAGASGVIVVNNAPGNPITMGSTSPEPTILIPSAMVSQADGDTIKAHLPGMNATLRATANPPPNRDSDFDNGVIVHEYGHGISIRLTGGPGATCLSGPEQMGEGWSDWFALVMTQQTATEQPIGRGIGTYVTFQDPPDFGGGIRPFPYSTDPSVNAQTYGDLATGTLSVPHGVGTVWASALWDLYWNLVRGVEVPEWGMSLPALGWKSDLFDRSGPLAGNEAALQLVMDGLKLQPCRPSFVDGRDAILAADEATFGGAYQCYVWHAFARRGVGVNAADGDGTLGVTEEFSPPEECTPAGCFIAPRFRGADVVTSTGGEGGCELTVSWSPAELLCAGATAATYDVYRSTEPDFEPGAGNLVASGISATSFVDGDVESGVRTFYVVRATDDLGNSDINTVRRSEKPVGGLEPGGEFFDDAGDTTAQQLAPAPTPLNTWTVREGDPADLNLTRHYASNATGTDYPLNACIALESETIYLGADPTLSFTTSWQIEPGYDGAIVEVATLGGDFQDWTKLDSLPYVGVMEFDGACPGAGFAAGEPVFNGFQPAPLPISGSLADYAGQAVRLRFVLASDAGLAFGGWLVDDVRIDDTMVPGPCTGGSGCEASAAVDDGDAAVDYRRGWHRVDDAAASGGGYHRRMGNAGGNGGSPSARVAFDGTGVTYRYVKTERGGSADVYLDGALVETISYASGGGTTYGHAATYEGLEAGAHELVVEHRDGAVTVDGFDFTCDGGGGANAAAAEFESVTETSDATASEGLVIRRQVEVGPADEELSVVVEAAWCR